RVGVFERVVSSEGGDGVVEVYDVSGRLVGRGERLEDIRLKRGVFFVKEGRRVRRVVVR
ncbi:MAG: T9SS type A sorting domain-containing protein, partial [Thermotogae bacterium]|nr:T9SS type A sorting domain-containing protein [Thermotogota bacterium]